MGVSLPMDTFFIDLLSMIGGFLNKAFALVLQFLPDSPLVALEKSPVITEYLGYLNFILPISPIIATMQAWVTCIGIYYIWQLVLRAIKAIE